MQLILKTSPWSCILASFAMAMDVSPAILIRFIGHDGSEIAFPDRPEPICRRGFHTQELIQLAWHMGYCVTPIELMPVIGETDGTRQKVIWELKPRFHIAESLVAKNRGVITGRGKSCGHAVAFEHGTVFDPDGYTFPFSRQQCQVSGFYPTCIWMVTLRDNPPTK